MSHQPPPTPSVVLMTGIMGAGKSTVAQALAEGLPRAAHVRGDLFRRMIVTGSVPMLPNAGDEARSQLRLRYRMGASVADAFAAAGFTAVYQGIVLGNEPARGRRLDPDPPVVRDRAGATTRDCAPARGFTPQGQRIRRVDSGGAS